MSLFDKEKPKHQGKPKLQYLDGDWDVWITDGQTKHRLGYPTHRLYGKHPNTESVKIPWTWDKLQASLVPMQRKYAAAYGGKWDLIILDRVAEPTPIDRPVGAREQAEAIILAGADTAGRRFLLARGKQKSNTVALGDMMALPEKAVTKPDDSLVLWDVDLASGNS